jgi:hypothetical protein
VCAIFEYEEKKNKNFLVRCSLPERAVPIRNGDAFAISTEKEKEIAKAVFGSGSTTGI